MDIKLEKVSIEEFIPLFQKYYGEVHDDCYHRPSEEWAEVARWRKEAYFFKNGDTVIGGVLQPDNVVTGLFTVPPFENYHKLLNFLLENLKDKVYTFYEVPAKLRRHYDDRFELVSTEVLMHMSPCDQNLKLPTDYKSDLIMEKDIDEIGRLFHKAFSSSDVYKKVDDVEAFISSSRNFFEYVQKYPSLYSSTKKVISPEGNIVGAILTMIDAGYPFAYNLGVDPEHQGKGIGRYLLCSLVDGVKNDYDKVRLFVHTNNPAKKMYSDIGFLPGECVKNFKY